MVTFLSRLNVLIFLKTSLQSPLPTSEHPHYRRRNCGEGEVRRPLGPYWVPWPPTPGLQLRHTGPWLHSVREGDEDLAGSRLRFWGWGHTWGRGRRLASAAQTELAGERYEDLRAHRGCTSSWAGYRWRWLPQWWVLEQLLCLSERIWVRCAGSMKQGITMTS